MMTKTALTVNNGAKQQSNATKNRTKNVLTVRNSPALHWVGDGFPVASILSPQPGRDGLDPFLLMDYAGPANFEPSDQARGVDTHPHRGFETVTVVFQGELEHRDSAGNSGSLLAGDVQWMTAGSGVLHEEKHSKSFTRDGGVLEMAQLWVNLPAEHKMTSPRYQELSGAEIPVVTLGGGAGTVRVIAGELEGTSGAAETVTPLFLWDVRLNAGADVTLPTLQDYTAGVYVRSGNLLAGGSHSADRGQLVLFDGAGEGIRLQADGESEVLVLGGRPIAQPIAAYGPFVMNTEAEIRDAIEDFRSGRFGRLG